jgi:glycosyltransferase involved in cell wall biosynthesis
MLSKKEPFEYPVAVNPGEVINCQIRVKGNKQYIGKKITACIHVTYKTDHLGRGRSTNVACSDIGTMIIGDKGEDLNDLSVSLVAPEFRATNAVKSVVYISTDSFTGIEIEGVKVVKQGGGRREGESSSLSEIIPSVAVLDTDGIIRLMKSKFRDEIGGNGRIDVVCEGLMLGHSGFAKAMRNVTYGLDKSGEGCENGCKINVKAVILDGDCIGSSKTEIGKRIVELSSNNNVGRGGIGESGGGFYISMNFPLGVRRHPGFYNIAYIMYETVDFPKVFVDHIRNNGIDEIWTPSVFCKDSMERAGLGGDNGIGIHVMPLGVDTHMFSREFADEPRLIPGNLGGELGGKFKFLTACGYSERKGISILIRAFNRAFAGKDAGKVALYFKGGWYNAGKAIGEMNAIINGMGIPIGNRPLIVYDFNIYPDEVLASLYKGCDAFVLPSRGEGWSLPLCEAMSMSMPTIGTRWSGNLDFMNDENSYLINIDGFALEPRCDWVTGYYIGQKFAVPNEDHLVELFRYVYEHQDEGIEKGKIAREWMVKNFDWKVSCAKMKARLEKIVNG